MSDSHYLAYAQGGMTRNDLFLVVSASEKSDVGFEYGLEGETDDNTWQQNTGGFDIPLDGVSCVSVNAWNDIDLSREICVLWGIRDDGSPEADALRQALEEFILAKVQGISLDQYSAFENPSEWLALGDGIQSQANKIRETGGSVKDAVAAAIAEMKAEAIEDDVLFDTEDWSAVRVELMSAVQTASDDFVQ